MKSMLSLIACAEREARLRQSFYPKRIERGQMSPELAQHEIDCMIQIAQFLRHLNDNPALDWPQHTQD